MDIDNVDGSIILTGYEMGLRHHLWKVESIRKELLLLPVCDDDQSTVPVNFLCVYFIKERLSPSIPPLGFYDIQCWDECILAKLFREPIVGTVM
jgi:hypothetical protein